jgi:hypothetical protein
MTVVTTWPSARAPLHAADGEVVRLGAARREDDLVVVAAEERGDLLARALDRLTGAAPYTCPLEGLPKCSRRYGSIASTTSGSSGVVALWSR